jgi:hypothetical protein
MQCATSYFFILILNTKVNYVYAKTGTFKRGLARIGAECI